MSVVLAHDAAAAPRPHPPFTDLLDIAAEVVRIKLASCVLDWLGDAVVLVRLCGKPSVGQVLARQIDEPH